MSKFEALNKMEEITDNPPKNLKESDEMITKLMLCSADFLNELNDSMAGTLKGINIPFIAAAMEYQTEQLKKAITDDAQKGLYELAKNVINSSVKSVRIVVPIVDKKGVEEQNSD